MTKLIVLTFLITSQVFAIKFYEPFANITDITFEVRSKEINELFKTKFLSLEKEANIYFKVYYARPARIAVRLKGAKNLNKEVVAKIEKYFSEKILLLIESSIDNFFSNYKKSPTSTKESLKFADENGILEFQEIIVNNATSKDVQVVLRKPLGTHIINYTFGAKRNELERIVKKEYEGIGSIIMDINIHYEDINDHFLPVQIQGKYEQTMRGAEDDYQVTRTLLETLEFSRFNINANSALKWFLKQP